MDLSLLFKMLKRGCCPDSQRRSVSIITPEGVSGDTRHYKFTMYFGAVLFKGLKDEEEDLFYLNPSFDLESLL